MDLAHPTHFTAMQVRDGKTLGLGFHLTRLDDASAELFGVALDGERVSRYVRNALSDGPPDASVRVNVFRSDADDGVRVVVSVRPPASAPTRAQNLQSVQYQRPLAHIKHGGGFGQSYFRGLAHGNGFDEALFVGRYGAISEGSITNIGFTGSDSIVWPDAPALPIMPCRRSRTSCVPRAGSCGRPRSIRSERGSYGRRLPTHDDGLVEADDVAAAQHGRQAAAVCPFTIERPVMRQRWERLTFLHWPFDPALVQRLLPKGLEVDTFGGTAWVGLVPFFMHVATPYGQEAPWVSRFCETNVRTYVRDQNGRAGIWFFSLDAARLGAVVVARTTYRLPYFWSAMRISQRDREIGYTCWRPGARAASSRVRISVGDRYAQEELDERDHFFTARWILFSVAGSRFRLARACHPPWPLHRAQADVVDDGLVEAAGLRAPLGPPLVHYSPGVDVAIGRPERGR